MSRQFGTGAAALTAEGQTNAVPRHSVPHGNRRISYLEIYQRILMVPSFV